MMEWQNGGKAENRITEQLKIAPNSKQRTINGTHIRAKSNTNITQTSVINIVFQRSLIQTLVFRRLV